MWRSCIGLVIDPLQAIYQGQYRNHIILYLLCRTTVTAMYCITFVYMMCALMKSGSLNWPWSTKILRLFVTRMHKNLLWYWKFSENSWSRLSKLPLFSIDHDSLPVAESRDKTTVFYNSVLKSTSVDYDFFVKELQSESKTYSDNLFWHYK